MGALGLHDEMARHYLRDLGNLIREDALEARRDRDQARPEERGFYLGRLAAYHSVVSLMKNQALAFGMTDEDLGLGEIDPDQELI
jgi:hypothetical protein